MPGSRCIQHQVLSAGQNVFPVMALLLWQASRRFSLATGQSLNDGSAGLGFDWKKICIEIGKDRAMLDWLDGRVSTRYAPNENFARELWELFMLGEGNGYSEEDIQNAGLEEAFHDVSVKLRIHIIDIGFHQTDIVVAPFSLRHYFFSDNNP